MREGNSGSSEITSNVTAVIQTRGVDVCISIISMEVREIVRFWVYFEGGTTLIF